MLDVIRRGLVRHFDQQLVFELLTAHQEAKHNFYLGGLRLSAVEGGRFCEAAFRLLEQATSGKPTPLGRKIDAERVMLNLANLPKGSYPDSIRVHIPRALRVVYDIRNNRDAAHLADGIDPNFQDAALVVSVLDWVLAEFVRLYHSMPANEAQKIVEGLVARKAPAIQEFAGFLKVLKPNLKASEYILLLLYERGTAGALYAEIEKWMRPPMRNNLQRTLHRLVNDKAFVHLDDKKHLYFITKLGSITVEKSKLHEPGAIP